MKEIKRDCHCELCGKDFESSRPFSEVVAEAADLFPYIDVNDAEESACLCEECFIRLAEHYKIDGFTKYIDKH